VIDERFLMHRLRSSSYASMTGAVLMGAWVLYNLYGRGIMRWDLMIIMSVMAAVKLGALFYFRRTN